MTNCERKSDGNFPGSSRNSDPKPLNKSPSSVKSLSGINGPLICYKPSFSIYWFGPLQSIDPLLYKWYEITLEHIEPLTFFQKLVGFYNDNDLIFEVGYRNLLKILLILHARQEILNEHYLNEHSRTGIHGPIDGGLTKFRINDVWIWTFFSWFQETDIETSANNETNLCVWMFR